MHFWGGAGNGLAVVNFWERLQARGDFGARRGSFWAFLGIFGALIFGRFVVARARNGEL